MSGHNKRDTVLIVEGMALHSVTKDKDFLEETMANIKKWHPAVAVTIKPFYADIQKIDPITGIVTEWEKKEGFSLWYSPVGALD